MLRLPKTSKRSNIVIPCSNSSLGNNGRRNYLNLHTLIPRVTFTWNPWNHDLWKYLNKQAVSLEMDLEPFEYIYKSDHSHEILGKDFHEKVNEIKSKQFCPSNLTSNVDEITKRLHETHSVIIEGSQLRQVVLSSMHTTSWIIFDPDVMYELTITKDNEIYYFFVQDNEINRRGRIVKDQINIPHSLKWSERIEDIFSVDDSNWKDIAKYYEIIVPPSINSKVNYMVERLQYNYDKSDVDLILENGVMVNFSSRNELDIKLSRFKHPHKRIYFIVLTENIANNASNTLTTYDTVLEAAKELVFGYGNRYSYFAFSAPELLQSFILREFESSFIKPFDYPNEFSDGDVNEIDSLASFFTEEYQVARDLRSKISDIRTRKERINSEARIFYQTFKESTEKYQSHINNIFECLFYAGMYMRQWKGFNYPFPIKEIATKEMEKTGDMSFEIGASENINKARNLIRLVDSKIIDRLPIKTYNQSSREIIDYGYPLRRFVRNIEKGDYCIRMASLPLIVTAIYYGEILPGNKLPPINLGDFDSIS